MRSDELTADLVRSSAKEAKRAAKRAKTPVATPRTARVLAQMDAEERASLLPPSPLRLLSQTPAWAILPARRYSTEAERRAARAATQKKYQAKAKLNVAAEAARRERKRAYQGPWVAEKRVKVRAAKQEQLAVGHRAVYTVWLTCWTVTMLRSGWSLPRLTIGRQSVMTL